MNDLYPYLRPLLFQFDAERIHTWTLASISKFPGLISVYHKESPVHVMGLSFPNPLGLAAGLDKNGIAIPAFARMGFGFLEVGTVTPKPQPGNPRPRLFRLAEAQAVINRMGFNNAGVDALCAHVAAVKAQCPALIGINIGKNKTTPNENALEDYLYCLEKAYPQADYITINISSPNTQGLRDLQHGNALTHLLTGIKAKQQALNDATARYVPVVVKIAPDNSEAELEEMLTIIDSVGIDGIIATNTTLDKSAVNSLAHGSETGGLSGAPLTAKSTQILARIRERLPKIPLIAAGGVMNAADYQAKLAAGADLVQIYTGLIYQGPNLIKACLEA